MIETIKYTGKDLRIDKFLVEQLQDITRNKIQKMITNQEILVNGKIIKANYILKENDIIQITPQAQEEVLITKENIPLDIVYEDSDLIVINKPSGMVVHPGAGNYQGTLVNALMYHCNSLSNQENTIRAGIVHRLDKDTSGLIVACKNDYTHNFLSNQFAKHTVKKIYYCLVEGVIPHNVGKITAPIGRDPQYRQQMTVIAGGKEAITNFKVITRFEKNTLIEVSIETGRTHQIRVHMKYIGYPVVGDPVYGHKKTVMETGQMLHSATLGFILPRSKEYKEFNASLPAYFQEYIDKLN